MLGVALACLHPPAATLMETTSYFGNSAAFRLNVPSPVDTARRLAAAVEPTLEKLGVAREDYLVLAQLWERDGQTAQHLAMRLHIHESVVEARIERLEESGYVERDATAEPEDLWLTPDGWTLYARAPRVPSSLLCHVLSWLDREEATLDSPSLETRGFPDS